MFLLLLLVYISQGLSLLCWHINAISSFWIYLWNTKRFQLLFWQQSFNEVILSLERVFVGCKIILNIFLCKGEVVFKKFDFLRLRLNN